jgi:hypothetical protein
MPKRKTSSSTSKLKKGLGQGHGQDYKPFLHPREVPSRGLATRIKGWKTGRAHYFLSKLERDYFFALEWSPIVRDIREQFPLPREATLRIAERLGIRHPRDPKTKEPVVMTTDFVIDVETGGSTTLKARSIKYSNDLNSLRTLEKLEIERTYWHEQGVEWGIVTECEVPTKLAKNVEWIHSALDPAEAPGLTPEDIPLLEKELHREVTANLTMSLARIGMELDKRLGLRGGTALWVVRHLIASRLWAVDMMAKIVPNEPLLMTRTTITAAMGGDGEP